MFKFCPRCATPLADRELLEDGGPTLRLACPADACGFVHYDNPTPAVGGFPRPQALKLIQELEPFERGWYAAPVGWVGYDDAEFAVAIRSGLVDRDRLLLFAGAGIVSGSQAEEEWAEVENKIRHFTDLFTDIIPQQISNPLVS